MNNLLSDHYTAFEIIQLIEATGKDEDELSEWLEHDFIDEGDEIPSIDEFISHMDYQSRLMDLCSMTDDETEFGILWAQEFCGA